MQGKGQLPSAWLARAHFGQHAFHLKPFATALHVTEEDVTQGRHYPGRVCICMGTWVRFVAGGLSQEGAYISVDKYV